MLLSTVVYGSNEIRAYYESSLNLYATIRNSAGNVWHVVDQGFEAWGTDANDADDYDIALTDKSGSLYLGDFDSAISAGYYSIMTYQRAGANPADTDYAIAYEEGYWNGSDWYPTSQHLKEIQDYTDLIVLVDTTVAGPNDANDFTLTAGLDVNDCYTGMHILVQDANDSHWEIRRIMEWRSTRECYVDNTLGFTPDTGDLAYIVGVSYGGLLDDIYRIVQRIQTGTYVYNYEQGQPAAGGGVTIFDATGDDP